MKLQDVFSVGVIYRAEDGAKLALEIPGQTLDRALTPLQGN